MEQFLAHLVGDYLLQNNWMATKKLTNFWVATFHGLTYTLPFLFITTNLTALLIIGATHVFIDYFQLGDRFMWIREYLSPSQKQVSWDRFSETKGDLDTWMFFYLRVAVDNTIHMLINFWAITNFG